MLLLYLLISTFVLCNGDMVCMSSKFSDCTKDAAEETAEEHCHNIQEKITCLKEKAKECGEITVVQELITDLVEICDNGSKPHELFKKHGDCAMPLFMSAHEEGGPCSEDLPDDASEDAEQRVKAKCMSNAVKYNCIRNKIKDKCSDEGVYIFCKVSGAALRLYEGFCVERGFSPPGGLYKECVLNEATAIGGDLVSRLLQIAAVLLSFKMLNM